VAARALGAERYSSLAALWAVVYLVGPGFFLPVEQEVARVLSSRRARGLGSGLLIRQAGLLGGGIAAVLVTVTAVASGPLGNRLFDGESLLVVALGVALFGYCAQHLIRGLLSGTSRFLAYGLVLGAEGTLRLAGCIALAAGGVSVAGPYGLIIGLAPFVATAVAASSKSPATPGPEGSWSELTRALGYLMASSLLAQFLVNAGPITVALLQTGPQSGLAGRFLASLIVVRIPLFLLQAVQTALLPKLAGLAAAGKRQDFRRVLGRVVTAVSVVGAATAAGALVAGPWAVRLLFGPGFALGRRDMALLAAATAAYMLALVLALAVVAVAGHAQVALGWLAGSACFAVGTALGSSIPFRVELGYLAGSGAAALAMTVTLFSLLNRLGTPPELSAAGTASIQVEP
jgi:O-antigen/teichoic acid export membrane protein